MAFNPTQKNIKTLRAMFTKHGFDSKTWLDAERGLGVTVETLKKYCSDLKQKPSEIKALNPAEGVVFDLKEKVRTLESAIKTINRERLSDSIVREAIIGLKPNPKPAPNWLGVYSAKSALPGVPTLFASDWHWGEVVEPSQIGGVNSFNLEIAHQRAKSMIETTIDLLFTHIANPKYPGIVFALGGDMVSGDIHEELSESNELPIMPVVKDLHGVLVWCITELANKFGKVFVPCVTGNHGRNTKKIRAKHRNNTSFDWLIYQFLEKHFENDKRVTFFIPDGSDAFYEVMGHKYLLTHGDQFRGGDGVIGALGPIIRGDHRKRSRNAQIDMAYDTMLLGHWHQLIQLERLIVNGSLKGYDEYAYTSNFGFEPPRQALWLTHPKFGITFAMPVVLDRDLGSKKGDSWVSWKDAA